MSEVPDNFVRTGFWIDQARGSVLGATITTNTRTATVLIAVLALLVSIAATHIWRIFLFAYHQFRSLPGTQDGLHRQQQALLRTLPAAGDILLDFVCLSWLWRGKVKRPLGRCLFPSSVAILFIGGTIIAGVLTSLAVETGNIDVLVDSGYCGIPPLDTPKPNGAAEYQIFAGNFESEIASYAANCYSTSSIPSLCRSFVKPRLSMKTFDTSCPFDSSICLAGPGKNNLGLELDTGYLDSLEDLGVNAKGSDRVRFRYRATCAPVQVEGRYTVKNMTQSNWYDTNGNHQFLPGEQALVFHYGANDFSTVNSHNNYGVEKVNATYWKSTYELNYTTNYIFDSLVFGHPERFIDRTGESYFIPELQFKNADTVLTLIFPGSITYTKPVNDPVFAAHTKLNDCVGNPKSPECLRYAPDHPAGAIGCKQQTQYCIPSKRGKFEDCTDFLGLEQLALQRSKLEGTWGRMNGVQNATSSFIMTAIVSLQAAVHASGPVLQASRQSYEQSVVSLPDDQWKIESKTQADFALAKLQVWLATIAHGPLGTNQDFDDLVMRPSTPAEKQLCESFKLKKPGGFANINVFALTFTIAISALLALMDAVLLKISIYASRVQKRLKPRIDHWIQDGVLQLQRKAYQSQDGGAVWLRLDKEIPVLDVGERWSSPSPTCVRSLESVVISNECASTDRSVTESHPKHSSVTASGSLNDEKTDLVETLLSNEPESAENSDLSAAENVAMQRIRSSHG